MQRTWAPIVSRRASCVKALQKTTIMTEKPLWGSEWEQDKKKKKSVTDNNCKKAGRAAEQTQDWTHTRSKLSLIAWGGCYLLCTEYLNVPLTKTKAAEMETSICPMTKQLPPPSAGDICGTACVKCSFLFKILCVWQARVSLLSVSFFISTSEAPSCSYLLQCNPPLILAFSQSLSLSTSSKKV